MWLYLRQYTSFLAFPCWRLLIVAAIHCVPRDLSTQNYFQVSVNVTLGFDSSKSNLFTAHCLYQSEEECIKRLCEFASSPDQIPLPLDVNFSTMDWTYCQDSYKALLSECTTATVNSVPRARSPAPSNSGSIASLGARVKAMVNHHKH